MKEMVLFLGLLTAGPMLAERGKMLSPKELMQVREEKVLENKKERQREEEVLKQSSKRDRSASPLSKPQR